MSVIVYEGGKPRIMPETQTIVTETENGGTCEWKPDYMMQIGPTKITENGEFTPDSEGYYGWSEVEVDVKNDLGDWTVSIDEDGKPHIKTDDWDLTIDENGFPELGDLDIDDALANLDFDTDIDISLDDMNLNIDTLDTDFELNLDTLELTETELPDEIRIMHVPNKTSYNDGEEIDLDGLVVQAYRGGEVWEGEDGRYIDGYIPAHELNFEPTTALYGQKYLDSLKLENTKIPYLTYELCPLPAFKRKGWIWRHTGIFKSGTWPWGFYYEYGRPDFAEFSYTHIWISEDKIYTNTRDTRLVNFRFVEGSNRFYVYADFVASGVLLGTDDVTAMVFDNYWLVGETINTVYVSWPRPKDNRLLSAWFKITVEESEVGE